MTQSKLFRVSLGHNYSGEEVDELSMLTIVVVDDDRSFRDAVASLIRSLGFCARAYGSGEELLSHGTLAGVEVAVIDVHLPGMSGFEVQSRLSRQEHPPSVIFVSANASAETGSKARERSTPFLLKPFHGALLIEAIERVRSRDALADDLRAPASR